MDILEKIDIVVGKHLTLNEASFSNARLEKAVKLLIKVVEKRTGEKFYPFGYNNLENFSKSNGLSGFGLMYILDSGKLVRFNWEKGIDSVNIITSIDVWKNLSNIEKPTANAEIPPDINVVELSNLISSFIKRPSSGTISEAKKTQKQIDAETYGLDVNLPYGEFRKALGQKKKELKAKGGVVEKSTLTTSIDKGKKALSQQKFADPELIFQDLDDLVRMVVVGAQPSLLVTGMAGIGKTYGVTKIVKEGMGSEGKKWIHIKGKLSPLGLYSTLFINRDKLIVFDDADSVFANEDTVNMLKAALDSYDERLISWISPRTIDTSKMDKGSIEALFKEVEEMLATDPGNKKLKFPNRFPFTGKIIFVSNIHESKMDSAIKSRSFVIDITLKSQDVIKRIETILDKLGEGSMEQKKEVLKYLKEAEEKTGREVNIRSFILSMRVRQSGSPNWKRLVEQYT